MKDVYKRQHEVSAAAHGHFGTRVLIQHGKIAALEDRKSVV